MQDLDVVDAVRLGSRAEVLNDLKIPVEHECKI